VSQVIYQVPATVATIKIPALELADRLHVGLLVQLRSVLPSLEANASPMQIVMTVHMILHVDGIISM